METNELEKLKTTIKLRNSKIKELQNELLLYTNQKELIEKQEKRIELLETKLDKVNDKKEELYEKVIGHMTQLEYKGK